MQEAIAVYNSDELDTEPGNGGDNNVHLKDWLVEGKKKLDEAREALRYLCEPVPLPREMEQFLHYFCGDAANPNALNETEALRVSFYKAVALFARAYADLAQNLAEAGYDDAAATALQKEVEFFVEIRAAIKKHSGEELDIKPYEADMRHLINTYIQAEPAADLGDLGEMSLTELIIKTGIHDAIARKLNEKGRLSKNAIAEGIINNVRKTIIRDQLTDPRFYEQMSKLLDDLIKQSRADAAAYEEFLRKAEALVKRLAEKQPEEGVPAALHGKREATVIYNNLRGSRARRATFRGRRASRRRRGRGRACLADRSRGSRAGTGGMEGRPGAGGAGAERPVSRFSTGTARRRWPCSRSSRTSRGTDGRDDPDRRHRHRDDAQGHQACPPVGAPADWVASVWSHPPERAWRSREPTRSRRSDGSGSSERNCKARHGRLPAGSSSEKATTSGVGAICCPSLKRTQSRPCGSVTAESLSSCARAAAWRSGMRSCRSGTGRCCTRWCRALIRKWEAKLGVTVSGYFLQRMKTKWGGCNHRAGNIRLNTELVKKPKDLLEYVVVHEMVHLDRTDAQRAVRCAAQQALPGLARGPGGAERAAAGRGGMESCRPKRPAHLRGSWAQELARPATCRRREP